MNLKKLSKTLALALRHHPERYGITLDDEGWASVDDLVAGIRKRHPKPYGVVTASDFLRVIEHADKPRYEMQGGRIRALHGHSVAQKIAKTPTPPPQVLYHGTPENALAAIMQSGLQPMSRQYVHLTTDIEMALNVGDRKRDKTILLVIDAARAAAEGIAFYQTSAVVWLADDIPPQYITPHDE